MVEAVVKLPRNRVKEAVAYLLVIVAAEVVTMFFHPLAGIIGHAVILATVIVHSARTNDRAHQRLVLSLVLVPLVRVIDLSLGLSLIPVPTMGWFPIIYTPLIVASVVIARTLGYKWGEVGLSFKSPPIQLGIASSGLVFGWAEYLILKPEAMVTQLTWSEVLPLALILLVFTWFAEDFAFRRALQRSAVGLFG